jgi:hypothetical protein
MANSYYTTRARRLGHAIQEFLKDESGRLAEAVHHSVSGGFFPQDDVHFALEHLRQSVSAETLENWVDAVFYDDDLGAGTPAGADSSPRVLCLHAGNLPMVGLQDIIATLLSGAGYHGKVSRKDAYLLPALLDFLNETGDFGQLHYSIDLNDFKALHADIVMFSGSEHSITEVEKRLQEGRMMKPDARLLVRTAHTSAAFIEPDAITLQNKNALFEAVFQYQGKGCRSLNAIFTPDPHALLALFKQEKQRGFVNHEYIRRVMHPQSVSPELRYLSAFNEAIQRPYVQIGNIVIQISEPQPETEGLITITPARKTDSEQQILDFISSCGTGFQSFYTHASRLQYAGQLPTEALQQAQRPPVDWKPDGVDVLQWLQTSIHQEAEQAGGSHS